ncbi:hypothetical protein TrST_g13902 [Triparma strigata]|uniref:GTP-binding protein n=1 Tax=Triparma strigata TaxID=1606541 RepID=A0A9W7BA13_9STRA|nr:hypothetical protein TrST_g13902 [Triparma strigata]
MQPLIWDRPQTAPGKSHLSTLRKLRAQRRLDRITTPSARKNAVVRDTHTYLTTKVDPIMSGAITYMLIEQPEKGKIIDVLLNYFTQLAAGITLTPTSKSTPTKTRSMDRLYMAKAMSPVFTKLMNMVLALRPENVEQYIIGCLNDMKLSGDYDIVEEVLNVEAVPTAPEVVEGEPVVTEETAATETVGSTEGDDVAMPAKMTILTLGLSLSGKTTMLKAIQGDPNPTPKPTVGFVPHALQLGSSVVTFYDLGGGDSIRDIWPNYYAETHGLIYVLDSSSDDMTFKDACSVFLESVSSPALAGKPCLLILNKKDLPSYRDTEEVLETLTLPPSCTICELTLHPQKTPSKSLDPEIDVNLSSLFNRIASDFSTISERVDNDVKEQLKKEEDEKKAKDKRVMKKSLNKAYSLNGFTPIDIFTPSDGYEFLAQEVGFMKAEELVEEGREVAELCGFQKIAMMLAAGMKEPVSKKKKRYEWSEIKEYIQECKAECERGKVDEEAFKDVEEGGVGGGGFDWGAV